MILNNFGEVLPRFAGVNTRGGRGNNGGDTIKGHKNMWFWLNISFEKTCCKGIEWGWVGKRFGFLTPTERGKGKNPPHVDCLLTPTLILLHCQRYFNVIHYLQPCTAITFEL